MTFAKWHKLKPNESTACVRDTLLCCLALTLTFGVAALAIGAMIVFG